MALPHFDPLRWSLYLVAFVIVTYCFIVLGTAIVCWWHAAEIVAGSFKCDAEGRLFKALAAALAAAVAIAAGYRSRKSE